MRSLVIDTDGGTDDAVALWWALRRLGVGVAAVLVTGGNVDRMAAAANVARVLRAAGRPDVPVAVGAAGPSGPAPAAAALAERARRLHGADGLGGTAAAWPTDGPAAGVTEPAERLLVRLTAARPGQLDVVTIGPLSTLAAALRLDQRLPRQLRSLTVMGGTAAAGGAVGAGEANIGFDPDAAGAVLAAPWSGDTPPLLVPVDVTLATPLMADDLAVCAGASTPAARFLSEPLRRYAAAYASDAATTRVPPGSCPCHDLVAVLAAAGAGVVTRTATMSLTLGSASGPAAARWRVARAVDGEVVRRAFRTTVAAEP